MDDRDSLSRLTEREKVCLRQWLRHKSAKEIAADLGISHHAVEKRLKMARTKLGATSSLEAARMLGEAEGYGQAVTQSPDLVSDALPLHSAFTRLTVLGVAIMILVGAIVLGLLLQPSAFSQAANKQPAGPPAERVFTPSSVPTAGTEAALRGLVAGLASGSPDYDKLSPQFAEVVRRDLPMTHPMFSSMGELKSVTFRGRGAMGDDFYNLVFANGGVTMSAALDADGRMAGGILAPPGERVFTPGSVPTAGTEAALRRLVAGLASGSPDYDKLSPQFAEVVRRDLPKTHPLFSSMGELKSVTFRGRGAMGDDVYKLVFANGGVTMSATLDANGRMAGGILQPEGPAGR
jgi:DNA-binding CsgD family transcriptional regulator